MTAESALAIMFLALVAQRGFELRLAKRNEVWAREQGAIEHGSAHYLFFLLLHGGWLVGWVSEAIATGPSLWYGWPAALAAFFFAQVLRYWAIAALGRRWNTRIFVVPGAPRIRRGPYRLLPHPNYVAVCVELFAVPAMFGAWFTAGIASLLNAALTLGVRIPVENAALAQAERCDAASVGTAAKPW